MSGYQNRFLHLLILGIVLFQFVGVEAFSSNTFNIKTYGAKGDGKTLNSVAINKAITACADKGGGTVIIPQGIYLTGTIEMKSHVSLYLEEGAISKGTSDLSAYKYFHPEKEFVEYNKSEKPEWNRALILGIGVSDIMISGNGVIDGDHVLDINGEESMRGPHTLLFAMSRNLTFSGITVRCAANYAFMAYCIENSIFQNLTIEEGWDGIHIRGGKNVIVRDCKLFTGDDAIAGGYWEDVVITDCQINSACNGIRLIMPATNLKIAHCSFKGPGVYPHRTSKELKRRYMLSAVLLQPGGWGPAEGRLDNIHIHDLDIENMENPFMFILNLGNECNHILVERVKARRIFKSTASIESWKGGSFQDIILRDIDLEFCGHDEPGLKNIVAAQPHVDSRILPCWGLYVRNVKNLILDNVKLSYTEQELRPAIYLDNVANAELNRVECKETSATNVIVTSNSGSIKTNETDFK